MRTAIMLSMNDSSPPAISIQNLALRFEGRSILEDFSAAIPSGGRITLTGPSGSGKSSILRCIMGFAQPAGGKILVEGERLTGESVWHLRRKLAYVAQEPVLNTGSLREEFQRPFQYAANHGKEGHLEKLPQLLKRFLLPQTLLDQDVRKLSGGEKQRAAIISALMLDRNIFLLDEPASALDARSRDAVLSFFAEQNDLTVLAVSHAPQSFELGGETISLPARTDTEGAA
jgi:ABC-type multidrug transport system ATPase subunit